ncbi:NAD(P)-binding protein [Pseudoalteromonas piscicida]
MSKQKVAILGGGVSAMTAAVYMTEQEDWQERYDITVYQQGWRLGGKGASGRNAEYGERIEEHGLHVWFGAYVNSFRAIETVYNKLERSSDIPIHTWQQALKPHSLVVLQEYIDQQWQTWSVDFPEIQVIQQMALSIYIFGRF